MSTYLAEVNAAADSGAQLTRGLLELLAWMVRDMHQPRSCPDFLTDGQFLAGHRDQLDRTPPAHCRRAF